MLQRKIEGGAKGAYRADIDGLRAIAVAAVVFYHAFPSTLPGGFVGVDIFFVISGFLITSIIHAEIVDGHFSILTFYAKRARRIFPALVTVMVAVLIAGWFLLLPDEYEEVGKHVAAGSSFISNLVLLTEAGYFDATAKFKPLLHLWSLGIEEQFYLLWPLMLIIALKARRYGPALIGICGAASIAYCIALTRTHPYSAFYLPQSRFWELLAGGAVAMILVSRNRRLDDFMERRSDVIAAIGLALVVGSVLLVRENRHFPGPSAFYPVAGACLLIAVGMRSTINRFALAARPMRLIGLISYPLYLWHWPLLSFPAIILGAEPSLGVRLLAVAASVVMAFGTYWLIERPIRYRGRLALPALVSALALAVVGFSGFVVMMKQGIPERPAIQRLAGAQALFVGPLWQFTSNDICKQRYPLAGSEKYGWWFCMANKDADPTVLILGSSYANHHYPGIASNEAFAGQSVLSIGSCEPGWVTESDVEANLDADEFNPCTTRHAYDQMNMINGIIAKGTIKLAILDGLVRSPPTPAYIEAVEKRIAFLEAHGAKVVLYTPHMKSDYFIKACFARPLRSPAETCEVPISRAEEITKTMKPLVDHLRSTHPEVAIFDPNTLFCNGATCSFKRDGKPLFRDEYNHLSEFGSDKMAANLVDWLKSNRPEMLRTLTTSQQ
ncbi:acyltransferase family protein [Rhizobium leguminosarum]|uniref:acyltransferase family protein n=1 Tax=Rhizobium leguminosarum TaxID=384 RepID=UPI0004B99BE5|nr:acyltransferase family protein [Rhizobium leguminosarum]